MTQLFLLWVGFTSVYYQADQQVVEKTYEIKIEMIGSSSPSAA